MPPLSHPNWFPRPPKRSTDSRHADLDDFAPRSSSAAAYSHLERFSSTLPARHRPNILSAASDALGLRKKIGSVSRRRPNFSSLPHPAGVMPGVIEISARNNTTVTSSDGTTAHRDCEHEERERLRDAAAQSIGLGPGLLLDSHRSESHLSLDSLQTPLPSLPPFPATLAALRPLIQLSATVPKFSPNSSLLVYALAKQWKPRTIVLTSHPPTHETHVHLFKNTSKNDREIERLQVTEDTVIFVAEEDVSGRGNVVKFVAKDVSARRSAATGEDCPHTMWYLQIADTAESQRWIATIKAAVLAQRAVRAGLDISAQPNGRNEPKGDMDVMLSMHLQGIITMNSARPSPLSQPTPASPSPTASLRSLGMSISSSPSPSTTVKGIFSTSRPRSPSIEGSATQHAEGSFGVAGASLLTMLRNKSSADSTSSPARSLPLSPSSGSGRGSPAPSLRSTNMPVITASDLKISRERDTPDLSHTVPGVRPSTAPPIPSLATQGALTFSLQPPPRKCKNVAATPPALLLPDQKTMYKQAGGNRSVAGNFGIPSRGSGDETPGENSPVSPASLHFSAGQSDSFLPRVGFEAPPFSVDEAHDSEGSEELTTPPGNGNETADLSSPVVESALTDKLPQSVAISKRWSRQSNALPKQPAPPSKPPPAIPLSSENSHRTSMESSTSIPVVRSLDRSPSPSSFNSLSRPRTSPQSNSSSPTFWKRASISSTYSVGSVSTCESRIRPLVPVSASGGSFSFKPVAGNVSSSRPMSLYVPGPSPVAHIATTKRRSMPPPRPAPNFAPPPAPIVQESAVQAGPSKIPAFVPPKSFRSSVAQRALRLSLTSPKPPPSAALPPRPDEPAITRSHRRGSSAGTPDLHPIPASRPHSSSLSDPDPTLPSPPPSRTLTIRQRLRNLSTPPTSHPPAQSPLSLAPPSLQVSTLDLSDDHEDDLPTPYFVSPQPFGLGEHITTMQNEPSFLQLSSPAAEPTTVPPPSSGAMSSGLPGTSPSEADCEFVALSPPPPRRGSRPFAVAPTRTENFDGEGSGSDAPQEEGTLLALTQSGSMVSLGFVTT